MKYIIFTFDGHGLPVGYHLQKEGADVIVGQVQDKKDVISDLEKNSICRSICRRTSCKWLSDNLLLLIYKYVINL